MADNHGTPFDVETSTETGAEAPEVIWTCWLGGGAAAPCVYAKFREVGAGVSTGAALTVNVTGTVYGLFAAPEEVSTTVPE
jgi:hypothetical protein